MAKAGSTEKVVRKIRNQRRRGLKTRVHGEGVPLPELVHGPASHDGLDFEQGGRNSYPDFRLVKFTEGYELKGLA